MSERPSATPNGRSFPQMPPCGTLSLVGSTATLLALFELLRFLVRRATSLPESAYSSAVIILEASVRREGIVVVALSLALAWIVRKRHGSWRWDVFDSGSALRLICLAAAVPLVWEYSTYQYNYYFDRWHGADRLLLLAMLAGLARSPMFLFPLALIVRGVIQQFVWPLEGFIWTVDDHLIDVLLIVGAGLALRCMLRTSVTIPVLFVILCRVAANYWVPGLGKLRMGFTTIDHLHFAVAGAWAHGWMGWMKPEAIVSVSDAIRPFDPVLQVAALTIECGAILVLWHRRATVSLLIAWVLFHIGVFFLMGYCFWKWLLLNSAIAFVISRRHVDLFDVTRFPLRVVVGAVLVVMAPFWCEPARLTWYHSRLAATWRASAIDDDGNVVRLSPAWFAPYDFTFAMSQLGYLSRLPQLTYPYGVTSSTLRANKLLSAQTVASVCELETEYGRDWFDPERHAVFERFVRTVLTRRLERSATSPRASLAPPLLWCRRDQETSRLPASIRRLRVERYRTVLLPGELTDEPVETCVDVDAIPHTVVRAPD